MIKRQYTVWKSQWLTHRNSDTGHLVLTRCEGLVWCGIIGWQLWSLCQVVRGRFCTCSRKCPIRCASVFSYGSGLTGALCSLVLFQTGCEVRLALNLLLKITLIFWSSCLHFTRAGTTGMHHHTPCLSGTEDQIQGLRHAGQALYQLSYISNSSGVFSQMKLHTGKGKILIILISFLHMPTTLEQITLEISIEPR